MADTITVTCPECEKAMKAPADAQGKKVRCKACGHTFVIKGGKKDKPAADKPPGKAAAAKPAPKPAPKKGAADDDDEDDGNPYGLTSTEKGHRCPECANEMESEDAVVCLHCGYNTLTRQRHQTRKVHDTTGSDQFIWLLPGILCVITIIILIALDIWYAMQIKGLVKDAWYEFIGSGACTLWFIIISLFGMFFAGRFAVKRLILHPMPPEIEKSK
jgi:DNA-directed RNA polymerase subunit RPC12/RpoP